MAYVEDAIVGLTDIPLLESEISLVDDQQYNLVYSSNAFSWVKDEPASYLPDEPSNVNDVHYNLAYTTLNGFQWEQDLSGGNVPDVPSAPTSGDHYNLEYDGTNFTWSIDNQADSLPEAPTSPVDDQHYNLFYDGTDFSWTEDDSSGTIPAFTETDQTDYVLQLDSSNDLTWVEADYTDDTTYTVANGSDALSFTVTNDLDSTVQNITLDDFNPNVPDFQHTDDSDYILRRDTGATEARWEEANAVKYDTSTQGLSATEQENARTNIDVYSETEVDNLISGDASVQLTQAEWNDDTNTTEAEISPEKLTDTIEHVVDQTFVNDLDVDAATLGGESPDFYETTFTDEDSGTAFTLSDIEKNTAGDTLTFTDGTDSFTFQGVTTFADLTDIGNLTIPADDQDPQLTTDIASMGYVEDLPNDWDGSALVDSGAQDTARTSIDVYSTTETDDLLTNFTDDNDVADRTLTTVSKNAVGDTLTFSDGTNELTFQGVTTFADLTDIGNFTIPADDQDPQITTDVASMGYVEDVLTKFTDDDGNTDLTLATVSKNSAGDTLTFSDGTDELTFEGITEFTKLTDNRGAAVATEEEFTGDGSTVVFALAPDSSVDLIDTLTVAVQGTFTTAFTIDDDFVITFTTAVDDGDQILVTYNLESPIFTIPANHDAPSVGTDLISLDYFVDQGPHLFTGGNEDTRDTIALDEGTGEHYKSEKDLVADITRWYWYHIRWVKPI